MKNLISDLCKQQYRYVVRIKDVYNQLCNTKVLFIFLLLVSCRGSSTKLTDNPTRTGTSVPATTIKTNTTASAIPTGTNPANDDMNPVGEHYESPIPSAPPYSDDLPPSYEESEEEAIKAQKEAEQLEAEFKRVNYEDIAYESHLKRDKAIQSNNKELAYTYLKMFVDDVKKCRQYETKILAKEESEQYWSRFGDNHSILRLVTDNILVSRRKQKSALVGMVNIYRERAKKKAQDTKDFIQEYYNSVYNKIKEKKYKDKYNALYDKKYEQLTTQKIIFWIRADAKLDEHTKQAMEQEAQKIAKQEAESYIHTKAQKDAAYAKLCGRLEKYKAYLLNIENKLKSYLQEVQTVQQVEPQITPKPHCWQ